MGLISRSCAASSEPWGCCRWVGKLRPDTEAPLPLLHKPQDVLLKHPHALLGGDHLKAVVLEEIRSNVVMADDSASKFCYHGACSAVEHVSGSDCCLVAHAFGPGASRQHVGPNYQALGEVSVCATQVLFNGFEPKLCTFQVDVSVSQMDYEHVWTRVGITLEATHLACKFRPGHLWISPLTEPHWRVFIPGRRGTFCQYPFGQI